VSIEENKKIVLRFTEGMGKGERSVVDELTTPDFVQHNLTTGAHADREATKRGNEAAHVAFPDVSITCDDVIAEGDKVVLRFTFKGTQTGQLGNIAPTGKTTEFSRIGIFRLENGKIAEIWMLNDFFRSYQQLGVLPPTREIGR
jgi:predicted ester cyclase